MYNNYLLMIQNHGILVFLSLETEGHKYVSAFWSLQKTCSPTCVICFQSYMESYYVDWVWMEVTYKMLVLIFYNNNVKHSV